MKKNFTLLLTLAVAIVAFSQVPEKMSYQAVVRNTNGELVKNSSVGMQISILQGSEIGTPVYVETHNKATNENGLVTLEIGGGTQVTGTFAGINWSTGVYFLKTGTDPTGGTNYTITGTSQLLSVPYALYSKNAVDKAYVDALEKKLRNLEDIVYTQLPLPTDGLVAYYPFNGNANDESGNNHNGTVAGAILTNNRMGIPNNAYYFDGISNYIYITNSSLVSGGYASISIWVKTDGTNQGYPIISGNQNDYNIFVDKDSVTVWIVTNKTSATSPMTAFFTKNGYLPPNQWNHIVLNYDGITLKMYINKVLSKSIPASGQIWTLQPDYLAFGLYFLNGSPHTISSYKGVLDDVRIYNRALNNTEIQQLYHEGGYIIP